MFFFLSPASKNQRSQLPMQRGDTCHGPRQQQQPLLPRIPWNFPAPEPREEGKGTHQEGAGSREGGGGGSTSHEQPRQRGSCILPTRRHRAEEPAQGHTARVAEPDRGASLPGPRVASSKSSSGGRWTRSVCAVPWATWGYRALGM